MQRAAGEQLLRQPGGLDLFAAIYSGGEMTTEAFLGAVVRLARDRLEADGMEPVAAYEAVLLSIAIDFPAVIMTTLTEYGDDQQSEDLLTEVLAETRAMLAAQQGIRLELILTASSAGSGQPRHQRPPLGIGAGEARQSAGQG